VPYVTSCLWLSDARPQRFYTVRLGEAVGVHLVTIDGENVERDFPIAGSVEHLRMVAWYLLGVASAAELEMKQCTT
jgi:hypothetical protein